MKINRILFAGFFLILALNLFAQQRREGEISFISSQNIYVKFESTDGISEGDTLFLNKGNTLLPAVFVKFLSSQSCAGDRLTNEDITVGTKLIAFIKSTEAKLPEKEVEHQITDNIEKPIEDSGEFKNESPVLSGISGKIGLSGYSTLSNSAGSKDFQKWRYVFSFDGDSIYKSPFSFESYLTFSYRADEWNSVSQNIGDALRIYNLAVKYNFTNETSLWIGRRINSYISSVSAIDGVQFETKFGNFFTGLIIGSRPNFTDFGLNTKLFQYGVYVARNDAIKNSSMQNTLAYFEQTNNFKTDRRFLYFQHNNNLIPKINLFISAEADIYKRENGTSKSTFDLTGFYFMTRYTPSRIVNFSASYDARKNVIYYETFKSFADSLLESETRQGLRFRVNLRPFNLVFVGLTYGYRFRKGDEKPTKNFGGFITHSRVPLINSSVSFSYNRLQTNYLDGDVIGIRTYNDIIFGLLSGGIGYRNVLYKFASGIPDMKQNIASIDLTVTLFRKLLLSLNYEGTFEKTSSYSRVFLNITQRF
ncbi:MAG: hypothetical protein V1720_14055 [bacterium]